ncbi:MAG: UDP-N-acetylmuramoyl-tripeptide--D-alanyl-D-alanine ligase [Bernardetiaceae bacterium]|nr:UDP-N-acetylmuramoyl-tripeptide--D-alanyl-D-alanine ligase [Bernardetiaceae bacterium]
MSVQDLYAYYQKAKASVSTDTRKIQKGDIFFALKGANFDGNRFANQALEAGAAYAVIDDPTYAQSERHLLVDDVLKALQDLARYRRELLKIPVFALTGSNGKTTTKELLRAVLSTKFDCYATQGNLNNHIGVPLSLLAMPAHTELAIIEMGANKIGDIAELCDIARPDYGLITNIGDAHLEGFGSREGVLRGKTELYMHLIKHKGKVLISSAEPMLSQMIHRFENPFVYGSEGEPAYLAFERCDPFLVYSDAQGHSHQTQMLGAYNLQNISAALAVAAFFDIAEEKAHQAVCAYKPQNSRSQWLETAHNRIFLDAYNANASSMKAAIDSFDKLDATKKVLILGDMLEMGTQTRQVHREIIEQIAQMKCEKALLCGKNFSAARKNNDLMLFFENITEAEAYLESNPIKNAHVLLKGSRGIGLEKLQPYL